MSGIKKTVIMVLGLFALLLVILFGSLVYITHYKVDTVDTQESPDGVYELKLQSVACMYIIEAKRTKMDHGTMRMEQSLIFVLMCMIAVM